MHSTFISFAISSAYWIFLLVLSGKAIWFGYDLWNNWSVSMMYIVPKMGKICSIEINVCQWIFIHFRPSFFVSRFHFGSGCCQLMNKLSGQFFILCREKNVFVLILSVKIKLVILSHHTTDVKRDRNTVDIQLMFPAVMPPVTESKREREGVNEQEYAFSLILILTQVMKWFGWIF